MTSKGPEASQRGSLVDAKKLGRTYWTVVFLGGSLTLARFSEAFCYSERSPLDYR